MAKETNSELKENTIRSIRSIEGTVHTPDSLKTSPEENADLSDSSAASTKAESAEGVKGSSKFAPKLPAPKLPAPRLPKISSKLAGLAAVILLGGGAIAALNFSQRTPRSLSPAGAQLVPQDALSTVTVTTDEIAWNKLRQFGTADSQAQFDQLLTEWKDRLFTLNGYSFKRDIKPWIGDRVTLAFLPANRSDAAGQTQDESAAEGLSAATQNVALIVPIADPARAKSLLDKGPQRSAITWEDRSYKNIPIKTIETGENQTVQAAVIGSDWLLLSNTAAGVEQVIDTYRGKRSLRNVAGYRNATADLAQPQPLGKSFAQFYLNIPVATAALKTPAGTSVGQRGSIVPLQGSQGIVATALIESEGVRFLGTSWLLPKNDLAYSDLSNEADDMARRLPGDTLLALSGSNLQQTWRSFSEGNVSPPFFPDAQNLRAGLLSQTGLDIEEDIMPWASGEFAFGLLPPAEVPEEDETGAIAASPLLLMVQTNDRATAESVWRQIDDVMVSRYRYQVETTELPEGSLTRWISPFQGVQFSHGWLPGNVAFFTVGSGAADSLIPEPSTSLAGTRLFQTLTGDAPTPNNGQFFLDLARINETNGVFPLPQLPLDGQTSAIEAIGLTSSVGDRTMDYDLYIKLPKAARPGPF
ncbi:MAG: DUF3352 domain-containing protein [Cyanobacteria bacterium P01_D01_bin.1]